MWYRVFNTQPNNPSPSALLETLTATGIPATGDFKGDELGWTSGEIHLEDGTPILLERYLTTDDDIREDLNTWAGWVETQDFYAGRHQLMERIIQTQEMITLRKPISVANESVMESALLKLCQVMSMNGSGIYQIDTQGFFDAPGNLLLEEY